MIRGTRPREIKHILIVIKTNQAASWLVPQVSALLDRGLDVQVLLPAGDGSLRRKLDDLGVAVIESPFDFSFRASLTTLRSLWALRRLIVATRPDAVFYHLYASALAARISTLGLRLLRIHMVAGPLYLESLPIRTVERALCRLDDVLIAGSRHTATLYRELGYPSARLYTVPYGVDTTHFSPGVDERVKLLSVDADTFVCIMVAYVYGPKTAVHRGVGIKGHEVLLKAWQRFHAETPDVPKLLLIVGSGFDASGEAYRQKLMHEYGVGEDPTVRWVSTVGDPRPWYNSSDVSISPSLSENHGAALEASAMGLPVIVSDAGGLPETVTPDTGWQVPAGQVPPLVDALYDAHASRGRRLRDMGIRSREHCISAFSHAASLPRIVSIIDEVGSR